MPRIAYRALGLLACGVIMVGLIAARPLRAPAPLFQPALNHKQISPGAASTSYVSRVERRAARLIRPPQAGPAQIRRALAAAEGARGLRAPAPMRIAGNGPAMRGQLVGQTERLDFYVGSRTFSAGEVAGITAKIEQALRNAEVHFGTTLKRRVSVGFYRVPPKKGVRGMAYTADGRAELFYRPGENLGRAITIAAHELGHHLEAQRYGEEAQRRADTILHEGMATWIAADRWLPMCEASSWRQRAQQLHNAGIPLRLLSAERSGADNAYELWASFVDFLAQRYGWDKLDALYASGRGRAPGSANYEKILGKNLDELADDWRGWINDE